ncbi:MAG: GntR family transcriptional regulator [Actinomycetota bacterium]
MKGRIGSLETGPPLRLRVYDTLEDLIVERTLRPGEHLSELELAAEFGTSRNPVREALQLLQREGWVDLRPRQGAFVHEPTVREVDEVFAVRRALEVEAAQRAAANRSHDDVDALREALEEGREALADGAPSAVVAANTTFHRMLTRVADNSVLAGMVGRLDKRIRWYFGPVVEARGQASWGEHGQIVDAIERKAPDEAGELMWAHVEATREAFHASLI